MKLLAELQSSREVLVSDRDARRLARDGGWQQMPPALAPSPVFMASRGQILQAAGLDDETVDWLKATGRKSWRRRIVDACFRVLFWLVVLAALAAAAAFWARLVYELIVHLAK